MVRCNWRATPTSLECVLVEAYLRAIANVLVIDQTTSLPIKLL